MLLTENIINIGYPEMINEYHSYSIGIMKLA